MLGSLLGKLYRDVISRIFGFDIILEKRLPLLVRQEIDSALHAFVRGDSGGRGLAADVEHTARFLAAVSSADYFLKYMRMSRNLILAETLLKFALKQCVIDGLVMEFGVFRGKSLRIIADHASQTVFGFDSFQGLPEDWTNLQTKGQFSLQGVAPQFDQTNISLVPGWFEDTLPSFLDQHEGSARFIHVDADIYSSAVTILTALRARIVPGTVILFDEYFNYPGWEHHEHKAFQEFISESGLRFEYLGFASRECSVAVKIT
jgi:Methyltransferase domain